MFVYDIAKRTQKVLS